MLAAGATLLGASALAGSGAGAPKGGTLRVLADVSSVDPALAYDPVSWAIGYATCAKLFNYPDAAEVAGTGLVPEVVDRFTLSDDRLTYVFTLKQSYRFHTGARVTAQSFANAFDRNAKLRSPATQYMHEIVGADAVIDGKAQTISGVRVLGRYRLEIRLTKSVGDFTARLTMPFFCPILPGTSFDPKGIDNPAGSGPYYVAERIVNQRVVLERNRFYRGDRPANVDRVVITVSASAEAALRAVEDDAADFAPVPPIALRGLVEKYGVNRPGGRFFVAPFLGTAYIVFNHDRPAFRGPGQIPLKKAINYAIDRPALTRSFGYLAGKRTDQLLPPALARSESVYPLGGSSPAAARRWYARARVQPATLVFYTLNTPQGVAHAQVLEFNLRQLGIELEVRYFDGATVAERVLRPGEPYDLALGTFAVDYADGAGLFLPVVNDAGTNLDDASVRRRIDAAKNRLNGEERRRAWADLDVELMRDNPPWAPFMHLQRRIFVSPSTGCVLIHPVYGFDIAAACKK